MNVFDIIGPVMIGPSSSHTAGAVRLGRVVNKLIDNFLDEESAKEIGTLFDLVVVDLVWIIF